MTSPSSYSQLHSLEKWCCRCSAGRSLSKISILTRVNITETTMAANSATHCLHYGLVPHCIAPLGPGDLQSEHQYQESLERLSSPTLSYWWEHWGLDTCLSGYLLKLHWASGKARTQTWATQLPGLLESPIYFAIPICCIKFTFANFQGFSHPYKPNSGKGRNFGQQLRA